MKVSDYLIKATVVLKSFSGVEDIRLVHKLCSVHLLVLTPIDICIQIQKCNRDPI